MSFYIIMDSKGSYYLGKFDLAFDEILYLRKCHHNSSFVFYSNQALLSSCILKNRPDRLRYVSQLLESSKLENIHLLAAYYSGLNLTANNLINISKNFGINQRYINRDPDLFKFILNDYLTKKYGGNYFPFSSRYKIADLPKYPDIFFANISFPSQIRTPEIPNFFAYQPFGDEIRSLFREAHERVKIILRKQRKHKY